MREIKIPNLWKEVKMSDCVCVYDFQNGSEWWESGDYDPITKKVYFAGWLRPVPPMIAEVEPNEDDVINYISKFSKRCEFLYKKYLGLN